MDWKFDSARPIYSQIIEQIRLSIVSGELPSGSKLPSVRELASEAEVNPNTMQRALAELERTGLVYANRTSGRFITDNEDCIKAAKLEIARENVRSFLEGMEKIGYSKAETIAILENFKQGGTEE